MYLRIAFCVAALLGTVHLGAFGSNAEVIFVEPKCQSSSAVFFCTSLDAARIKADGAVRQRIQRSLEQGEENPIQDVRIAHYIFDDDETSDYLCTQYAKRRFSLTIFAQSSRVISPLKRKIQEALANCFGNDLVVHHIGCDLIREKSKCPKDVISTMHLKVIEIRRANGDMQAIASSGNLGQGMYANLEDWVWFPSARDDGSSIHSCMWDALDAFAAGPRSVSSIRSQYLTCSRNQSPSTSGITFQFLPAETDEFYKKFSGLSRDSTSIVILSMDFRDRRLSAALRSALVKGATVSFLVDDDWYYAGLTQKSTGTASVDDPVLANELLKEWPAQVDIRYLETNHYVLPLLNRLHHKMVVFTTGDRTTVLTGSLNLNSGAIRWNIDAAYWVSSPELTTAYQQYLARIATQSRARSEMPKEAPTQVKLK
ncbi:MAG: phospholipase D family protein [Delftia tsuruhatensis]